MEMIFGQLFLITALGKIVTDGTSRLEAGCIRPDGELGGGLRFRDVDDLGIGCPDEIRHAQKCRLTPWAPPPIATTPSGSIDASANTGQGCVAPKGVIAPRS